MIKTRQIEIEFSEPQLEILESTAQINLFYAGIASGKTYLIGANNFIKMIKFPKVRGFIGANTQEQLTKSTLVGVFKFWAVVGLKRDVHYVVDKQPLKNFIVHGERLKSYHNTISFQNGKLIFLASLENYKAIDGIEFGHADLDETKDSKEEAVKEVILARLRQVGMWLDKRGNITDNELEGVEGYNPLNIYTSPAKTEWISNWFEFPKYFEEITSKIFSKTDYFRKRVGKMLVVIASTYHNEHNLPKGFIENKIIAPNAHNPHRINMLLYGSPLAKSGNEYYTRWDRQKHIQVMPMPSGVPIHIGFDFNRKPYITGGLYKIWFKEDVGRWHIHKFDEICLPPPNNVTEDLCNEMINLWKHDLVNGVTYYGDYSGGNRRTNSKEDDYDIIRRILKPYLHNSSDKVIVNERIIKRKEFMNKMFYGSLPIDFTCDPKCVNFINDAEFMKEGPDGKKHKQIATDDNGMSYEKYGHCFVGETLITTSEGEKRIDEVKVGDLILTRKGYKRCKNTWNNGIKAVNTYLIGDRSLTCTDNHNIFTYNLGFVEVSELKNDNTFCIYDEYSKKTLAHILPIECISIDTTLKNVYDIEVEDEHEYFANGILVHNCADETEYVVTSAFDMYFNAD